MSKEQSGFWVQKFRLVAPRPKEKAVRDTASNTDWVWTEGGRGYLWRISCLFL